MMHSEGHTKFIPAKDGVPSVIIYMNVYFYCLTVVLKTFSEQHCKK